MNLKYEPDYVIHPCETIKECAAFYIAEHADTELTGEELDSLFDGVSPIDERKAEQLEKIFGPSKQFWLNLQNNYDKRKESLKCCNSEEGK